MKYMIASDLHGDAECIRRMFLRFEEEKADSLLLLGDYLYHGPRNSIPEDYDTQESARLLNEYKDRIIAISGNCDAEVDQMLLDFPITSYYMLFPSDPDENGKRVRVMAHHGHWGAEALHLQPGDVYLHGHTHLLMAEKDFAGYYEVNPGSVSIPKGGNPRSYCIWEGRRFTIKRLDNGETIKVLDF